MPLLIETFSSNPLDNNSYLIHDQSSRLAAIIDPSFETKPIVDKIQENQLTLKFILNTHAHFDHIAGVSDLLSKLDGSIEIGLHANDLPLWEQGGGGRFFGFNIELIESPTLLFSHGEGIQLGDAVIEVRHAPGHSPGHVIFYSDADKVCFCGDVIFRGSIGRTDLPGGNYEQLISSIRSQVLSLPGNTRLLSGHGPSTTVETERNTNPFL